MCSGGSCQGTGCTTRQTLDCGNVDAGCSMGACVTPTGTVIAVPDAGQPQPAPVDGGLPQVMVDGGSSEDAGPTEVDPNVAEPLSADPSNTELHTLDPVRGGCSAAPGMLLLGLFAWGRRRRV